MPNGYRIPFEEMLKCSICQDRIKDARWLPCGHTYCKDCLARSANVTYPRGNIQCSECKKTSQLPRGGAEGLPRCFAINILVDDINETFGGGSSGTNSRRSSTSNGGLSLGRHGFQARETFSCVVCLSLMRDTRYLPCGHAFCRECLTKQSRTTRGIKCCKCLKDHNLPPGGIDGLPVAYRINSIVAEMSNDSETSDESQASSSQTRHHQPPHHSRRSPALNSRPLMEDVEEAKRRAQARASQIQVFVRQINGRNLTIHINAHATVADLQREIQMSTNIDPSQQRLTFSGQNLIERTRSLSSYGIVNMSNIDMNVRLRGGIQL